jgi:hypothetical protein
MMYSAKQVAKMLQIGAANIKQFVCGSSWSGGASTFTRRERVTRHHITPATPNRGKKRRLRIPDDACVASSERRRMARLAHSRAAPSS